MLEESAFTNKGQRDETVCKIKMFECVIQNFLSTEPNDAFFFFLPDICKCFTRLKVLT